jgi:hypothetical protein
VGIENNCEYQRMSFLTHRNKLMFNLTQNHPN